MTDLAEAISTFPISSYAAKFMRTYDSGHGKDFYCDCFHCGGVKKLGINRFSKLIHCFRCNPDRGGHGPPKWNGRANLAQFIMLVEGCSWWDARKRIYELAGFEEPVKQRTYKQSKIPSGAISLSNASSEEPAVKLLYSRNVGHLIPMSYVSVDGRYSDRVILPCLFFDKLLGSECKALYPSQRPKSLFHPPGEFEAQGALYTSRAWDLSSKRVVVTESILDAEMFQEDNAIGCFGGSLTDTQISVLLDLGIEELVWFLDDGAWSIQSRCIRRRTLPLFQNFVLDVPHKQDPNSLKQAKCKELVTNPRHITSEWDLLMTSTEWGKDL